MCGRGYPVFVGLAKPHRMASEEVNNQRIYGELYVLPFYDSVSD